jgi:heat shock protein HslJ
MRIKGLVFLLAAAILFSCNPPAPVQKSGEAAEKQVVQAQTAPADSSKDTAPLESGTKTVFAKNPFLEGKKWILIQLKGKRVDVSKSNNPAYLYFNPATSKFEGSGSCNKVFGSYDLPAGDQIKFKDMGSTKMACPDMSTEDAFLEILKRAAKFKVGEIEMSLYTASDKNPLAIFTMMQGQ